MLSANLADWFEKNRPEKHNEKPYAESPAKIHEVAMESANQRYFEAKILDTLHELQILDSNREAEFDAIVQIASNICGVPISLLSLVDADRQWFKAAIGLDAVTQTPRDIAFCAHAVLGTSIFEVPDATLDIRFTGNPLVDGSPGIRFYAGAPIVLSDGSNVGTVCVIDRMPRKLDGQQKLALANLAVIAAKLIEGRNAVGRANQTMLQAQRAASVLEHSSDAIMGLSLDLAITWVNAAAEVLLEQSGSELVGTAFEQYIPDTERPALTEVIGRARFGMSRTEDTRLQLASGQTLAVTQLFAKKTNLEGEVVGFVVFIRDVREQVAAACALLNKEVELRFLLDNLIAGVFLHGPDGALLYSNPRAAQLLGLTEDFMHGRGLMDPAWHFVRQDGTRMPLDEYPVARVIATGEDARGLVLGVVKPLVGHTTWLLCDAKREHPDKPESSRIVVTVVDISLLINAEKNFAHSQQTLHDMFDNSMEPILLGKPDGTITAANAAACMVLGMEATEICKHGRRGIMDTEHDSYRNLYLERSRKGSVQGEIQMVRKGGEKFTVEISSTIYREVSGDIASSTFFRDISARKAAEALNLRLTYFDELTGLYNRRYLLENLKQSLAGAARSHRFGGVIFIDLDNFKQINDARGHLVGDELLQAVALRLRACVRADDTLARLGGDEFIVLMHDLGSDIVEATHNSALAAEKFRDALDHVFEIDNQLYKTAGSLGITLFPREEQGADDVLREADTAMYQAKSEGRNRIAFFDTAMRAEVESRLKLEYDLSKAIELGQFQAFVQPQFNAQRAQVGGEILLRWKHPDRGYISPVEFIPVAEDTGLILSIGDWVLARSVETLKRLQEINPQLSLSVNVSPRQFLQQHFVDKSVALLKSHEVDGSSLILEVTEGLLIQDWQEVLNRVGQLLQQQIRLSIDDFGTGYSSLAYLKRLPLYELKIDKGFIADIPQDTNDVAIVESILSIAKHLGLNVVAEGVETEAQAEFLLLHGCDILQGYLFSRPVPLEDWLQTLQIADTV